jgi:3',5'-cyclic AMP phosphodiesterase CpdA
MHHVPVRQELLVPETGRIGAPLRDPGPERLRVVFYSDSQGSREGHRALLAAIARERPDLVIFGGDAIDHLPAGHMPDWGGWQYAVPLWPQVIPGYPWVALASLIPFPAIVHETLLGAVAPPRPDPDLNGFLEDTRELRTSGTPFLFVPGNHDSYHREDLSEVARWFGPPGSPERDVDALWYSVDLGGWRFLLLDTGADLFGDRDPMPADGPQVRWLDAQLGEAERLGLRSIVVLHVPPFSSGKQERGARWVEERVVKDVLDRHPVALVLSGHIHAYERLERAAPGGAPLTYVVSGGAADRFFQAREERDPRSVVFLEGTHHYLVLDLSPQGIDARMIPLEAGRPADAFTVRTAAAVTRGARSPSAPRGRSARWSGRSR